MDPELVEMLLLGVGAYLAVGVVAALALHLRGLAAIDPATRGAKFGFRVLVTPGLVALWPWLVKRWVGVRGGAGGGEPAPGPDRPIGARSLRRWQALLVRGSLALAVGCGAFVLAERPPVRDPTLPAAVAGLVGGESPSADAAEGSTDRRALVALPPFPIDLHLRTSPGGSGLLEITTRRPLEVPALALYWRPLDPGAPTDSPGRDAHFVARVPAPVGPAETEATTVVDLPRAANSTAGEWVLVSIARPDVIVIAPADLTGTPDGGSR